METGQNNNVKIAGCFSPLPGSYFKDKSISKQEMKKPILRFNRRSSKR